ncbi:unnamed protein product [Camellia sinensis]
MFVYRDEGRIDKPNGFIEALQRGFTVRP